MINSTHCAFMAKQACATFSKVVQKITPPSANNFLKFFFALFAILTLNAATAWAESWTYTFKSPDAVKNNSITVNGATWNVNTTTGTGSPTISTGTYSKTYGLKFGSSKTNYYKTVVFTTDYFNNYNVSEVVVKILLNGGVNTILTTKQDDITIGSASFKTSQQWTELTTNTTKGSGGQLSLTIATTQAFYISSITVNYEIPSVTPDPVDPNATFSHGSYTVGGSALDLSTLWTSDSDGAVTYSIVEAGTTGASINGNSFTATAAGTCTVKASQASTSAYNAITQTATITVTAPTPANPYKVTLEAGPGTCAESVTEASAGAGVTLPTPTLDCGDWEFAGWTTSSVTTKTTSKPEILLTGEYNPTANITLYAVYQRTEETEGSNEESKTITLSPSTTTSGYTVGTETDSEGNTWSYYAAINNLSGTLEFGLNSNALNYNIGSPIFDGKVSSVSFKARNGSSSESRKFLFCSTNTTAQPTTGDLAEVSIPKSQQFTETYTADLSQSRVSQFYIYAPKALGITAISVTYTTSGSGSTTYYHSTPECAAPCTDAVTISKGTQSNGSFNLDKTEKQSTCNGAVTVTLSDIQPAAGYKFSAITQTGVDASKVTIDNTAKTVTYAQNTIGFSEINVTFTELPKYTVSFSTGTGNPTQADVKESVGGQGVTLPVGPAPACTDWTFAGWAETSVDKTTTAPTLLKANDKYQPTSSITLYAVYSQTETTLGEGEKLSQTLKYDSWSYTGSTTDKSSYSYRMFHKDSYVESATFDLSTLTKVVVYGGTFGGDKYNSLTIGDGANVWKTVAVTGSSQTGQNTFTDGEALSGIGKLRITSNSGTAPTNGVRISKIEIYTVSSITTTTYNSNPNCTPPAEYTITWWANGEKYHTQTAVEGTAIEVPTTSPNATEYACDDKVFVGWVDTEIIGSTDTKPTLIIEFDKITENKDFFAVFATRSSSEPTAYTAGEVGNFVLAAKNGDKWYALPTNPVVNSGKIQGVEIPVTTTNGVEHVTTANALGYTWTIANATNGQTISDGSKYIYHSNGGVDDTNLTYGIGTSFTWKIEKEDAGLTFKAMNGATVNDRGMLVNGTKFGGYSLSNETTNGYYRISVLPIADEISYSGYVTTCEATTEALSGKFSTGKYEYAEFATGNLQYKPSTDTWRFAKQQYQYVGKDNIYVGKEDYKGWIDLLGWSADDKFGVNPSNDNANYQGKFVDWGTLFPEEGWSTLSKNQWNYLLNQRTNAASLKQIAMVGETLGIMLFPDEWTLPAGCAPTQQTHHDEEDGEDYSCDFVSYNYTLAQWTELENAGAIFLPAAGRRTGGWGNETISPHMIGKAELDADGHYKHYADYYAYYWTSTKTSDKVNYLINCTLVDKVKDTYTVHAGHVDWVEEARYGQSVRLAKVTSTLIQLGSDDNSEVIEANAGQKVNVQVNRTFTANDGYYTICLPFNLNAEKIGKAYQVTSITEHVAEQGFNMVFNEVTELEAGQPYLILPNNLTNPIFENVTISYTDEGETVTASGAGINFEMVGVINGGGQTELGQYWVGDNGLFYNGDGTQTTDKLGLRVLFNITNTEGQRVNIRARVVLGENAATGLDNSQLPITDIQKVIENGQLIIIRNGEKYNIQGQKL